MFYLSYIEKCKGEDKFFAQYGTFNHIVHSKVESGELSEDDVVVYYISNFFDSVNARPPNEKIRSSYFSDGLNYWKQYHVPEEVVGVEKKVEFDIEGKKFVGFVDLIERTESGLNIVDHKSKTFKAPAKRPRKKETQASKEIDDYFKQLYLYSIPITKLYETPSALILNSFRNGSRIEREYSEEELEKAKRWALDAINKIQTTENWAQNYNEFQCYNICSFSNDCDLFQFYHSK